MLIIGCDYHPGFQQIAYVNTDTGELSEARLGHKEQAEQFYYDLKTHGVPVRVGMEASGHARWFERLLAELQFELWIGDAAEIRTKRVRKQKTDRQDAQLLLRLMIEDRFPRIWVADAENRDLRQLLWHRHRLVQMRTRVMNQLHVVALNEGLRRKKALWRPAGRRELEALSLAPWASRRRQDLLDLLDRLTPKIHELNEKLGTDRGATAGDPTTEHASRRRPADRTGVRVSDWNAGTFCLREADCQLRRAGAGGGIQRRSPTAGAHQQTRQRFIALPAGGSGAGHGAQRCAMAQPVLSPGHAARAQDRESRDGPETSGRVVLDVAERLGLPRNAATRFARGSARKSPWCAVNHRRNDWASRSPSPGSSK